MKITYDPKYNIAYIKLKSKKDKVETIKISDEINIDISPDGKLYGIELLNANKQLNLMKGAKLAFTNEFTGKTTQVALGV